MEKKVFAFPLLLGIYVLFFLGCTESHLGKDKIDPFLKKSRERTLPIEERIIAIDLFLMISKASKDTLKILKGLS